MQILERIATFLRSSDTGDLSDKAATQRPKPPMPESWAHFKIVELIGEGGFGSVYRARDTNLQTEVALKLVDLPGGRELRPAGALKEARLLARVRPTNVVTVHGADIVDGRVGIWMQLIEGRDALDAPAGHGPFGAARAALIGVDLCRALAAVHAARSLIHGDVKTRNVMREAGGQIVLMDFGTGRDLSALRLHGARDAAAGTPLYLAPEVFDGQPQSKVTDACRPRRPAVPHLVTNAYPSRDGRRPRSKRRTGATSARTCATRGPGSAAVVRRPRRARAQPRPRRPIPDGEAHSRRRCRVSPVSPSQSRSRTCEGMAERRGRRERGAGDHLATIWMEAAGRRASTGRAVPAAAARPSRRRRPATRLKRRSAGAAPAAAYAPPRRRPIAQAMRCS
jgi:hypothetical protein